MSLNASVGPLDTRSRNRSGSSVEQRRDLVAAEGRGGVRAIDDRLQVRRRYIVGVARQDREGELDDSRADAAPPARRGEARIALGHREPAVGREAFEQDRRERLWRQRAETRAAGADVTHYRRDVASVAIN